MHSESCLYEFVPVMVIGYAAAAGGLGVQLPCSLPMLPICEYAKLTYLVLVPLLEILISSPHFTYQADIYASIFYTPRARSVAQWLPPTHNVVSCLRASPMRVSAASMDHLWLSEKPIYAFFCLHWSIYPPLQHHCRCHCFSVRVPLLC